MEVDLPNGRRMTVIAVEEKLKRIGMDEDEIEDFLEEKRCPLCTKRLHPNVNSSGTMNHLRRCFGLREKAKEKL